MTVEIRVRLSCEGPAAGVPCVLLEAGMTGPGLLSQASEYEGPGTTMAAAIGRTRELAAAAGWLYEQRSGEAGGPPRMVDICRLCALERAGGRGR